MDCLIKILTMFLRKVKKANLCFHGDGKKPSRVKHLLAS
jgi:hypothetical protein